MSEKPVEQPNDTTHRHVIHYILDDERQHTRHEVLTPTEILQDAKPHPIDPATHYLIQLAGGEQISYLDKPHERIRMHEGMRFISEPTGPTPVS